MMMMKSSLESIEILETKIERKKIERERNKMWNWSMIIINAILTDIFKYLLLLLFFLYTRFLFDDNNNNNNT